MKVVHPSASIDLKTARFSFRCIAWVKNQVRRARDALAAPDSRLAANRAGRCVLRGRPRCCRLLRDGTCQARRENDQRSG
ncbi:hypothetical protein XaclCFBP3371_10010 [Xanthomonas euvesicatoria pv. citrumelonis]|nr:hypothetical protein XaclCFBP3371_10010 [Xanthomonas euvesicatoria pv. citrumelonis]